VKLAVNDTLVCLPNRYRKTVTSIAISGLFRFLQFFFHLIFRGSTVNSLEVFEIDL